MIPLDTVGGVHVRKMLLGSGEAMEVILGASAGAAFRGEKGREEREGKRRKGRERMSINNSSNITCSVDAMKCSADASKHSNSPVMVLTTTALEFYEK